MLFNDPLITVFDSGESSDPAAKPIKQVNQYLLVKKLGQGAYSKVYLGIEKETGKKFAVKKFVLGELQRNENGVSQLEREVSLMKRYKHTNILKLYEVLHDTENDIVYLIIDYADCGSLADLIDNTKNLEYDVIRSIFYQVLRGLQYLHNSGMVHQDIKPSNILINSNGKVLLADFGVGHSFQSTEMVVGTPAYQAPEALSDGDNGLMMCNPAKEDVWSLGVTLYQTVYKRIPYEGENVFEIIRNIRSTPLVLPEGGNPEIEDLIRGMLTVDPNMRLNVDEILMKQFFREFKEIIPITLSGKDGDIEINPKTPVTHINAVVCDGVTSFAKIGRLAITQLDLQDNNEEVEKEKLTEEPLLNEVPLESRSNCFECCLLL